MIYQSEFSSRADVFHSGCGEDLNYAPHMHESFELITVSEGRMRINVDGKSYDITAGQAVLVFPDQLHSLESLGPSRHALWIFSPKYVQAFSKAYADRMPASNVFTPDPFYISELMKISGKPSVWRAKGLLYSICAEFDDGAEYTERRKYESSVLPEIFKYIQSHYSSDCSLSALAKELGFSAVYLSRYFKEHTGIAFTEYVNRHRLEEACYIISNTDETFIRIAFECGFGSLRSFNRNFKRYIGVSPQEYKKRE